MCREFLTLDAYEIAHTKSESDLYLCIPEMLKRTFQTGFLNAQPPFEFVFTRCEITKELKAGVK